jgi:hypothetical protein
MATSEKAHVISENPKEVMLSEEKNPRSKESLVRDTLPQEVKTPKERLGGKTSLELSRQTFHRKAPAKKGERRCLRKSCRGIDHIIRTALHLQTTTRGSSQPSFKSNAVGRYYPAKRRSSKTRGRKLRESKVILDVK